MRMGSLRLRRFCTRWKKRKYVCEKNRIQACTKSSEGDADEADPPNFSRAGSISSRTRYQHRVTYRPRSDGGRIVVDLWSLILCPDSGIVRPAAATISHPFEKPRAESSHSFILRNMDRDEGRPHNAHCHRA